MDWLYTLLVYGAPWWLQAIILALVIYFLALLIIGPTLTHRYLIHGLGFIAVLATASKLRQEGYRRRMAEEDRAAKVAEDVAEEERRNVKDLPDADLNDKVDKWSRG